MKEKEKSESGGRAHLLHPRRTLRSRRRLGCGRLRPRSTSCLMRERWTEKENR